MDHELHYIDRGELLTLNIPKEVIQLVPRTVAEHMGILPIGYGDDGALLVAAGDPHNTSIIDEVKFYTGVHEVRVYNGFRSAVNKAIEENYNKLLGPLGAPDGQGVDFEAQFLGAEDDMEAFPGVFGRSALEQFVDSYKEKKSGSQGVSGSLVDMSLPDIVQVLAAARRSAVITMDDNGRYGQIHLKDGRIINAFYEEKEGEPAFYELVTWTTGNFRVDPDAEIAPEVIDKSNDAIILEGLRRMDEARSR